MSLIDYGKFPAEDKLQRARLQMYNKSPFFSYILLYMKFQEMPDKMREYFKNVMNSEPSMGVDPNGNCYWDRTFVDSLTELELQGVIVHEVLHLALQHLERGGARDRQILNIAQDIIINDIILHQSRDGYSEMFGLPKGGCLPNTNHEFSITTKTGEYVIKDTNLKSSEEVYEEIIDKIPRMKNMLQSLSMEASGDGKGDGQGGKATQQEKKEAEEKLKNFDGHLYGDKDEKQVDKGDAKGSSSSKAVNRGQKWKRIISEAATVAKQQGKLPAGLERLVEGILDSKINWKVMLYEFVVAQVIHDYSWSRPHKRGASLGIYLPATKKESLHIIYHVDTSGSMDEEELSQALGELQAIIDTFSNVNIDILIGDAEMQNTFKLTSENKEDLIDIAKGMKGGGGTDHRYVFEYIAENIPDAKLLICYTDGYTSFPEFPEEIPFKTLWVLTKNSCGVKDIPFGEVIKME